MSAHSDFQTASDPKSSRVDVVVPMISDADSDSPLLNRHVEISMANAVGGDPLYFGRTRHDDFIFVNGIDNPPCGDLIKSSLSGTPDKRIEGKKKKKKGRRAHNHCSTAVRLDFADRIPSNHGSPAEYSEEFPVSRSPVCQGGQVPSASLVDLRVRYLCPGDIDEVKDLCNQIFPIE